MPETGVCVACIYARCRQCAPENILKPNRILNQKHATRVDAVNHNVANKILSSLLFITFSIVSYL